MSTVFIIPFVKAYYLQDEVIIFKSDFLWLEWGKNDTGLKVTS